MRYRSEVPHDILNFNRIYDRHRCPLFAENDNTPANFMVRMYIRPESKKTMLYALVAGRTSGLLTVDEYRELTNLFRKIYPSGTINLRLSKQGSF